MKWQIPAKTFLLGEYAALTGLSAIVLTTTPCFELNLTNERNLNSIHPHSPAGLWLQEQALDQGLAWTDPYQGRGGLGASSAQFLSVYLAACHLKAKRPTFEHMLQAYHHVSWSGKGLKPSGYDVIAQSQQGCVYINQQKHIVQSHVWPFDDLALLLIHTGVKLATHQHLQATTLPQGVQDLSNLVEKALAAFKYADAEQLIDSINQYHQKLVQLNRVAQHSLDLIDEWSVLSEIRAIKGCGAMGADVLLIICSRLDKQAVYNNLISQNQLVIATELELNKQDKILEINPLMINNL